MSRPLLLAIAVLAVSLNTQAASADTIHKSGPPQDRFDLVLLAEGFPASEKADFEQSCRAILAQLKSHEPYKRYMPFLNVHTGFRPSAGDGIRDIDKTVYKTYRIGRTTAIRSKDFDKIAADAQLFAPEADRILVVCKGGLNGGTAYGLVGFVVTARGFPEVAAHELGHMIGGLADEYVNTTKAMQLSRHLDAMPGDIVSKVKAFLKAKLAGKKNVSATTNRSQIPWAHWIESGTPIPGDASTPGVSAHEGAWYFSRHVWRPRRLCTMNSRESDPFCEPCREQMILGLYQRTRPTRVSLNKGSFGHRVTVSTAIPGATIRWSEANLAGAVVTFPPGSPRRNVSVTVSDPSPWVRGTSRRQRLSSTYSFLVGDGAPTSADTTPAVTATRPSATTPTRPASTPAPTTTTTSAGFPRAGHVTAAALNVRSGPGRGNEVLGIVRQNERVVVLGGDSNGWSAIAFNGRRAYVATRYLRVASDGLVGSIGGSE